jgi:hypothetical protein
MKKLPITIERLFARTRRDGECMLWTGAMRAYRHGTIKHCGRTLVVHRLSYELHHGPIPDGCVVMHTCDRPLCINPAHLRAGTQQDNVDDMFAKGRQRPPKGASHPKAKLNESQVAEIRRRFVPRDHRNGTRALAREFGITHQALGALVRRETWRHVP